MSRVVATGSLPSPRIGPRVDIASLVVFRIAFGAIMLWEVIRYFQHGWISRYWIEPAFHFQYYGFDWVTPWPGPGMYLHFVVLGLAASCILCGLWYRVATVVMALGFAWMFLLEQARYLNHFYLIMLIAMIMVVVPAHTDASIDAQRRPELRSRWAPRWALWLVRFQVGIAYAGGGFAKLNSDWLAGEPMRMWLADRGLYEEWAVWMFANGGVLFDLCIVPALLWRRTRMLAFVAALVFNLMNAWMFQIGIFPWFMIAASTIFFEPDWPRRAARRLAAALGCFGSMGSAASIEEPGIEASPATEAGTVRPIGAAVKVALFAWVALQVLVPLRHHLYPGSPNWTEEGHRFAWHMKLRDKHSRAEFILNHPASGRTWTEVPGDFLEPWQVRKMSTRPDMILQFAHHLAALWESEGYEGIEVRTRVMASLNGRPRQLLIDPDVDLAREPRSLLPASWIVPLTTPLPVTGE
jgi:hypothetical protein